MRPGEEEADRNGECKGSRVVGPYIRTAGRWRRMDLEETLFVHLDRMYADILDARSPWLVFLRPPIELGDGPVCEALRG